MVTPPCDEDVMRGTCWPAGEILLVAVVGVPVGRPRRDRGTYGVYVVWRPTAGGCLGGGAGGNPDLGGARGDGKGRGRFETEDVGDDAAEDDGVHDMLGAGDRGVGTTSG